MADLYAVSTAAVPVDATLSANGVARRDTIVAASRNAITDTGGGYYYNPGPGYAGGFWPRDLLYMLEAGATISDSDQRRMLDWLLSKQLSSSVSTYPAGSIPDHLSASGQVGWGPGDYFGINPSGRLNSRPSMDNNVIVQQLAWQYGSARAWDATWQAWFTANATALVNAYNAIPRTGNLVTQYGSSPATTWGFLDCINLSGANIGCSVLSCNAARALSDMYGHANGAANQETWAVTAAAVQSAIQATFTTDAHGGYLKWTIGGNSDVMSPDVTGYAVCSGILNATQTAQASDWLNWRYGLDKAAGGAGDLFTFATGCRGGVRQRRVTDGNWSTFFLAVAAGTYQNGGYWFYTAGWIAGALAASHPATAAEYVVNAITDMLAGANAPYERADYGMTLTNMKYNASAAAIVSQAGISTTLAATSARDHIAVVWADTASGEDGWFLERKAV
jgi:hypothetical protein